MLVYNMYFEIVSILERSLSYSRNLHFRFGPMVFHLADIKIRLQVK